MSDPKRCRWCANEHDGDYCPVVSAISYHENGNVSRVEFVVPQAISRSIADQISGFKAAGAPVQPAESYPKIRGRE